MKHSRIEKTESLDKQNSVTGGDCLVLSVLPHAGGLGFSFGLPADGYDKLLIGRKTI